jgi:hypothetical protein
MILRKLAAVVAIFTLAVGLSVPAGAADTPYEQFVISPPPGDVPSLGVVIEDSQKLKNTFSTLQAFTSDGTQQGVSKVTSVLNCFEYGSKDCGQDKFFNFMANLGFCSVEVPTDCVQGVTATNSAGKKLAVNYVGAFPEKMSYAFKGNLQANLPTGGSTFRVDIPEAPHVAGTQYLIVAQATGSKNIGSPTFQTNEFSLGIFAVSKVSGRYQIAGPSTEVGAFKVLGMVSNQRVPYDLEANKLAPCAQSTTIECLLAWPLPQDIDFGLVLKMHTRIYGWLHGRTNNTAAEITVAADGDQVIQVSGRASVVPSVFAWFPKTNLPTTVSDYYANKPGEAFYGSGFGPFDASIGGPTSMLKDTLDYKESIFPEALAWYSALKDTAPMAPTQWSIRSTNSGDDPKRCFSSKLDLSGIVSTNSNFFIAGPPVYNKSENSLDYKVASPHFLPNGDVFKGTYNLLMKSDVARCIYGFSAAPVSASVSVVSADGTSQIATTVLGEKNGWLYLTASGFTFSSPTVRVKLTQEAPAPSTSATPTPVAAPAAAKKTSITCIKGKTSKKVTAVNPTCPKGYKKK